MDDSACIMCGQCINVCPTAAFLEKDHTERVWEALSLPRGVKHIVVQPAPSIRAAIGECFGMPIGTPVTGKLVTALRRLGFDAVFDTNFGADLTIIEEAHEFLRRLDGGGPLPLLTSCSPGWVNFLEKFYPEMIPYTSTCKSPMSMLSALAKTYYAEKKGLKPEEIYVVAHHALRGQEVRGLPPRARHGRRHALHRRGAHHPRAGLDDQVLRHRLRQPAGRRVRPARWASPRAPPTSSAPPAA